ncbi:MAG TPA: fatty acid desaturase CarF family protein, partial [Fimbriimonadaceae bacterium]|nr:fatty acid desaturase CarF family protein [Fimbriimonadaceae bacterium]
APRIPRVVRWLQCAGVVISPAHHARHHRSDGRRAFCVTTGWLNPALDRVDLFGRIERGVARRGDTP